MANDLSARNWQIDTPGAGVLFQSQVWIKFVEWYNPASGNTFVITDRNGKPIIEGIAEAAGDTQTFNLENIFEGIIVPILTGGVLFVHIK
jgi:hypothetical protein